MYCIIGIIIIIITIIIIIIITCCKQPGSIGLESIFFNFSHFKWYGHCFSFMPSFDERHVVSHKKLF